MYTRLYWRFIEEMGAVMQAGASKYPENNWVLLESDDLLNSLLRHVIEVASGSYKDGESGLSHFGHIAVNAMFLYFKEKQSGRLGGNAEFLNSVLNPGRNAE
jgi:hypothetical protein